VATALELPPGETIAEHLKAIIPNKRTLLVSQPFFQSVTESVQSVLMVLQLIARSLISDKSLGKHVFADFETAIDKLIKDHLDIYQGWPQQGFADWIARGEVLAVSPGAHIWAKLLLESRTELRHSQDKSTFMVSQLSALLSVWHRAVTSVGSEMEKDKGAVRALDRLFPLELVTQKQFTPPQPEGQATPEPPPEPCT
jgi:hypothetical protein